MSKHTPILFSTPMVQAILDGRKTMTRRVVKSRTYICDVADGVAYEMTEDDVQPIRCPYGQPGDILWVRESFCQGPMYNQVLYKADHQSDFRNPGWKPSLFMPKAACRIFLRVTDVRCERLGDITEDDAIADGVTPDLFTDHPNGVYYTGFMGLWESIHGAWNPDTWAWVVSFERIEKPENFR